MNISPILEHELVAEGALRILEKHGNNELTENRNKVKCLSNNLSHERDHLNRVRHLLDATWTIIDGLKLNKHFKPARAIGSYKNLEHIVKAELGSKLVDPL